MTDRRTSPHLAMNDDLVADVANPIAGPFRLADGKLVWLRPLGAEDAQRLMDLCERLSPSTLRRRFLRSVVRCDPVEAQRLAAVDQVQRVALVALPDPAADAPIVAVGRFHGDGSEQAELALLVDDAYQHVGLGRLLLSRLLREAAHLRLRVLEGHVLYDNAPMLRLLRTSGQPLEVHWDGGDVLRVQLAVPGQSAVAMPDVRLESNRSSTTSLCAPKIQQAVS